MAEKKIPLRMCVSCRQMKPKKEMLRVVRNKEGAIALDRTGKAPGRGAYVCDDPACVKKLAKAKVLNRVFSEDVPAEVYAAVEEAYDQK